MAQDGLDPMQAEIEAHYRWIESVSSRCLHNVDELAAMGNAPPSLLSHEPPARKPTFSERVDAVLVHRIWGLLTFALIMASLFVSIFWLASPIMHAMQTAVTWLGHMVTDGMADGPAQGASGRRRLWWCGRCSRIRTPDPPYSSHSSPSWRTAATSPALRS